jgi:molybdenum cofactor guanylyltransferase
MVAPDSGPIGVILAGGSGRRLGGKKALAPLGGKPLIGYPLSALRAVLGEVVVVAKPGASLPDLAGVLVWEEPSQPQHPSIGIVEALRRARGRAVVVCAVDMPFVSSAVLRGLALADAGGGLAVVAALNGQLQPHLGRYEPGALAFLERAGFECPLRAVVAGLDPVLVEVPEDQLFNVNTPEDLAAAEARLAGGPSGYPNVKS